MAWENVKTAPKDGTPVLLRSKCRCVVYVAQWVSTSLTRNGVVEHEFADWEAPDRRPLPYEFKPTEWTHIPA